MAVAHVAPNVDMSTHMAHRGSGVRGPQLLLTLFSFAALFGLTAVDNFQGGKQDSVEALPIFS